MKSALTATFLVIAVCSYSQDRIRTVSGEVINAKVLEINKDDIKYRKYSNLNGPVYVIKKQEISSVTYQNGETEKFNGNNLSDEKEKTIDASVDPDVVALFYEMTKRNKRVYIECDNENAIVHATNAIKRWGYWQITERRFNASFILSFNISFSGAEGYGSADFIYPGNGKIIRSTPEIKASPTYDLNVKRGLVNLIVDEGIKPMFYK